MNTKTIIKISRPKFWNYLAGTFLIGYTLGITSLADFYTPIFWILLGYFILPANFFLYGINDLFDQDTDQFNDKKSATEHRLKKNQTQQLTLLLWGAFFCSILILVILPSLLTKIIFLLFVFLSFAYSAPPFRFKTKPIIDSTSNILYILPGIIGYLTLSKQPITYAIILGISAWVVAMHLFSAIPDIIPDKKAHLKTTAVWLGQKKALFFCLILWSLFTIICLTQQALYPLNFLTIAYPLIPLYILVKPQASLIKIYWLFPYLNNTLGFILFWLLIYQKI